VDVVSSKSSGESVPELGLEHPSAHSLLKGCQSHVVPSEFYSQSLTLGFSQLVEVNVELIFSSLIFQMLPQG